MDTLNYNHLRYFWVVAREGGVVQAGRALRLSHPTLSAQVHMLEDHLGEKLFTKVGRKLVLTDVGRTAYRYAEEIFGLGRELVDAVHGKGGSRQVRLEVGIADVRRAAAREPRGAGHHPRRAPGPLRDARGPRGLSLVAAL